MWDIRGRPDVRSAACMHNCGDPKVQSSMPDFARNAHGNLAEQNRMVGGIRGADTSQPSLATATAPKREPHPMLSLATRQGCMACHGVERRIVGPSFREVAAKQGSNASAAALAAKIRSGGSGAWGAIPMPSQAQLTMADAEALALWIVGGAKAVQ